MPQRTQPHPDSVTYLLRDINGELWRRARARAVMQGRTMRDVLLDLISDYAAERPAVKPRSGSKERRKR
jgi:hypothetical protein